MNQLEQALFDAYPCKWRGNKYNEQAIKQLVDDSGASDAPGVLRYVRKRRKLLAEYLHLHPRTISRVIEDAGLSRLCLHRLMSLSLALRSEGAGLRSSATRDAMHEWAVATNDSPDDEWEVIRDLLGE